MKKIIFKSAEASNFLSIGEEPVKITFQPGLNIITGINRDNEERRNGVGKTTVLNFIHFGLFGELNGIKNELLVNNITQQKAVIVLEIDIENNGIIDKVKIVRTCLKSTDVILTINDIDKTRDSIKNTNAYIQELLNCTPDVFQNCISMSVNSTSSFMTKKKEDKRKFIESIFNLQVFSEMIKTLKEDLSEAKRVNDVEIAKIEELNRTIKVIHDRNLNKAQEREDNRKKYQARKTQYNGQLSALKDLVNDFVVVDTQTQIKEVGLLEQGLIKVDTAVQNVLNDITTKQTLISQETKRKASIGTAKDNCPVCLRAIEVGDKTHIEEEKNKIQQTIESYQKEIGDLEIKKKKYLDKKIDIKAGIKERTEQINNYKVAQETHKNNQSQIVRLEVEIKNIDEALNSIDLDSKSSVNELEELNQRLQASISTQKICKEKLSVLETSKFVLSEEGVKSIIIKRLINLFNNRLHYYLGRLSARCSCVFNEYFEEEIRDTKGKLLSYYNFSGAERKSIDLACLFAFSDLRKMQGNVSFNFSMYDELFDSSFDGQGVELIVRLLKDRVDETGEAVMVISHRKETSYFVTGEVIFLEKRGGITRRTTIHVG